MARASTRTWLPLDTWFAIIGENPLHSNGLVSNILFPGTTCGSPWQQFNWQDADKVSREDLAFAILQAEQKIAEEVGYNLLPDWVVSERVQNSRPADPTLFASTNLNLRGQRKSIPQLLRNYTISGGRKSSSAISTGVAVVRSDSNGDGYSDLMTITFATTVTEVNEIVVFFPGEDPNSSEDWEVRPLKSVVISAGVATVTFNSYQLIDPDLQLQVNAIADGEGIDADAAASYLSTVDVYRVFNDPQDQLTLMWEPGDSDVFNIGIPGCSCACGSCTDCVNCSFCTQSGCLMVRNERLGIMTYAPATWDATADAFDKVALAVCRDPDQFLVNYYSGWRDKTKARDLVEMDRYWQYAVAYYAASLLDRPTCGCDNVRKSIEYWQKDMALSETAQSHQLSLYAIDNQLGTTRGALYALKRIDAPDRKVGR